MEYITSRGFTFPEVPEELADYLWYSAWRIKLWPYTEHLAQAPERGYCLAWRVEPIERLSLPKPEELRFPRQGWLRVSKDTARRWLGQSDVVDDVTLDHIASSGNLRERLHALNTAMAEVAPERVRSIVSRTVRRDTELVKALKEVCGFRCQFPGCGIRIPKREGGFYVEVAHIQPLGCGGRSVIGNLLVLCPNHHKEFDHGNVEIAEQTVGLLRGRLNGNAFEIRLPGAPSATR